jgi:hypothetical protein
MTKPVGERKRGRFLMQVLWPAFLLAAITEGIFFSMIDPLDLEVVVVRLSSSREAAYTIGFFAFWALFTASSAMTYLLTCGSRPPGDELE